MRDSATTITFKAGTVELRPGENCSFSATYVMAKELEDSELLQTLYPADGLRVTLFDQAADSRRITFARAVHRRSLERVPEGSNEPKAKIFKIAGYLLPHQGVLIWWKKKPDYVDSEPAIAPLPLQEGDGNDRQTTEASQ